MSTLRQRRRHGEDDDARPAASSRPRITLETFDLYQKVSSDEAVQTSSGGTVSVIATLLCVVLILNEARSVVFPTTREHMIVDPVVEARLRVNFDITFHALTCAEANLDAMDVAGEQQNGVDHDIFKIRLAKDGTPIGSAFAHRLEEEAPAASASPLPPDYCGPCYGAQLREGQCCNSCDDVRTAYAERGWDVSNVTSTAEQCAREHRSDAIASLPGEGCRLTGFVSVNKVAGNLHVAMGETHARGAGHIHQFNPSLIATFNTSHTIHAFSFGEPYPGMKNPLDGVVKAVHSGSGVFMYFIKIVPTVYDKSGVRSKAALAAAAAAASAASDAAATTAGGSTDDASSSRSVLVTNQYSITSQFRPAIVLGNRINVLPGVFFVYDISPFMVTVTQDRSSIMSFITSVFAILGGVLTLATAIDAAIYYINRLRKHSATTSLMSIIAPLDKAAAPATVASSSAAMFRGSNVPATSPPAASVAPPVTSPMYAAPPVDSSSPSQQFTTVSPVAAAGPPAAAAYSSAPPYASSPQYAAGAPQHRKDA